MSASVLAPFPATHRRSQAGEPVWELAYCYPVQGDWSEADFLELSQQHRVELVDGCLEVLPLATLFHQLLADYVHSQLKAYLATNAPTELRRGRALFAPLPIRLGRLRYRDPDVAYFKPERLTNLHAQPKGADLVVEVVSEGQENRDRDLITKRTEYAAAGIAEYWIVDPQTRSVAVFVLDGGQYREHGMFVGGTAATSVLLPGFEINVDELFQQAESAAHGE